MPTAPDWHASLGPVAELPPELRNNDPAGYAWRVWRDRTPKLIARIADAHPYDTRRRDALGSLWREIESGRIEPLPAGAPDAARWQSHLGERWLDAPFLWSESYFYRRLLEAVGYFAPGAWRGVDPFSSLKSAELRTKQTRAALTAVADLAGRPAGERSRVKLLASLWGNQADLVVKVGQSPPARPGPAGDGQRASLVVDQTPELLRLLDDAAEVIIVTDNAGPELLADLVLADHLLGTPARSVRLHVKPYPYFVSDATAADVMECADRLGRTPASAAVAIRLKAAAAADRFTLHTHEFYGWPVGFDQIPAELADQYARASVTVLKGDLNYRRLVGDRSWPVHTPFAEVTAYFPGTVAALRVLKSDVLVGLPPDAGADAGADGPWRTDGTRALVQLTTR